VTTPGVEITHCAFECAKVLFVKIVVGLLPPALNWFRAVACKIVKSAKLPENSFAVELESCRIPFNTALPIVTAQHSTVPSAFTHDASGGHGRTGAESIRYFVHSK
jgi:hypothetical protein